MVYSDYGPDRETGAVCDYRMYDRIWQRVSPDLNPYPHIRDGGEEEITPPEEGVQLPVPHQEEQSLAPISEQQEESAGAAPVMTQCCMGTAARGSMDTLKGFLEEELAESRCCMSLSRQVCSRNAAQLLRRMAMEKREAARRLQAACYLINGRCCPVEAPLEHTRFGSLPEALRHCYHQDACNGYAYQQAAESTSDPCLAALLDELSRQSYRRADTVMRMLGEVLC